MSFHPFYKYAIALNQNLKQYVGLSADLKMMNPFENKNALEFSGKFYRKFYADFNSRYLILGINPGRHGAGVTGIPFTDSQRLENVCQIRTKDFSTYEPSSVFIYKVIESLGGVFSFYRHFYISSCCPLGLLKKKGNNYINYNYYDDVKTQKKLEPLMISHLKGLLKIPIQTNIIFCLGTGKNFKFLIKINKKYSFFEKIIPLDHPRYIMQYRFKFLDDYVGKYQNILSQQM